MKDEEKRTRKKVREQRWRWEEGVETREGFFKTGRGPDGTQELVVGGWGERREGDKGTLEVTASL